MLLKYKRTHDETGEEIFVASTSCRTVCFDTLYNEIVDNNLELLESGITSIIPDFPTTMYVVAKRETFLNENRFHMPIL